MATVDNIIFGKEIKGLNILNNIDYEYPLMDERKLTFQQSQLVRGKIKESIVKYRDLFKANIKFITHPLYEAWQKNEDKLVEIMPARELREPQFGVFIMRMNGMLGVTYFYCNVKNHEVFAMCIANNVIIECVASITKDLFWAYAPISGTPEYIQTGREYKATDTMDIMLELDYLLKHMDIDVKNLDARTKIKTPTCIYDNHTNHNIKIIDSKWFTTLVKSDGFKVRGHFRFQPKKKDGEWTKELIWINDFEKTGYTAPARKLSVV